MPTFCIRSSYPLDSFTIKLSVDENKDTAGIVINNTTVDGVFSQGCHARNADLLKLRDFLNAQFPTDNVVSKAPAEDPTPHASDPEPKKNGLSPGMLFLLTRVEKEERARRYALCNAAEGNRASMYEDFSKWREMLNAAFVSQDEDRIVSLLQPGSGQWSKRT